MANKDPVQQPGTVGSIMTQNVVTATDSQSIVQAARLLIENKVGALPVVDASGVCVGMLTATDIVRFEIDRIANDETDSFGLEATVEKDDQGNLRIGVEPLDQVQRYMNRELQTIEQDSSIEAAAKMMKYEKIHHLPVLDEKGRPIGILSTFDLLDK